MTEVQIVAEGLDFPEGPVVMADGSVIVLEVHAGRISRCWNGRKEVVSQPGGGPNGAAIGPDGALYLCNNGGQTAPAAEPAGRIERIDLATGRVERLYDACDGVALSAPNDLMFDTDGALWFTDLGRGTERGKEFGGLYCARPDGGAITRIKGRALSYNGVGISPDMKTVYLGARLRLRAAPRGAGAPAGRDCSWAGDAGQSRDHGRGECLRRDLVRRRRKHRHP
jgi:gluconolactonase